MKKAITRQIRSQKMHLTWENELQGQAQALGPVPGPQKFEKIIQVRILAPADAINRIFLPMLIDYGSGGGELQLERAGAAKKAR